MLNLTSAKSAINQILGRFNLRIVRNNYFRDLESKSHSSRDLAFLNALDPERRSLALTLLPSSVSQIRQDIYVLTSTKGRRNGYFVEIGACDGVKLSNTFLLERDFGWSGLVVEPARIWHDDLALNRFCAKDLRCVYSKSQATLNFHESRSPALSTLKDFRGSDFQAANRRPGHSYPVETVTLEDLLNQHGAPSEIDYLSIDTEGSEYEILRVFPFEKFRFGIVTCEHNYGPHRSEIEKLFEQNGYMRVMSDYSSFDDWFVHRDYLDS